MMTIKSKTALLRVGPTVLAFLFVASLSIPATRVFAQEQTPDINEMIAKAKTSADHEAIAAYYDRAAIAATAKAEMHDKMAATYSQYRPEYKPLPTHCRRVAKDYKGIAEEDTALAEAHRKMAKAAAQ